MRTVSNCYVLLAVDIIDKLKKVRNDDKFLPNIERHKGVEHHIIYDLDKDKATCYFGRVLASANKSDWDTPDSEIDIELLSRQREHVIKDFNRLFKENYSIDDCKLVFSKSRN